jgi:hypothetical protein
MNKQGESMTAYEQHPSIPPPWWRYPLVWLVIGLPAAVVMASLASAWIAVHTTDTVVEENYYRKGIEINRTLPDKAWFPHRWAAIMR